MDSEIHVYAVVSVRCLSVRLFVTLVYCMETTELIIKQLALDCSLVGILFYRHQTWLIYLRDNFIGALNTRGC